MNLIIKDNCINCGACAQISGEIFEMHCSGATLNSSKINENINACYDAVFFCPVAAIVIV